MATNVTAAMVLILASILPGTAHAETEFTLRIDEDLFSGMGNDADYTGGLALTFAGDMFAEPQARRTWIRRLDERLGMAARRYRYEFELGAAAFTPLPISELATQLGDRPYAGIVYTSVTVVRWGGTQSAATTILAGVLGSELVPAAQRHIHRVMGSDQPRGWTHQISDGGELTFRVMHEMTRASAVTDLGRTNAQWLYRMSAGAGLLTDVGFGVAARIGQFAEPHWAIHTSPLGLGDRMVSGSARVDRYLYVTLGARLSLYNAFLQGQFRHSDLTMSSSERRTLVPDASLGFVFDTERNRTVHYFLRAQRSEARLAAREEISIYGGIALSW